MSQCAWLLIALCLVRAAVADASEEAGVVEIDKELRKTAEPLRDAAKCGWSGDSRQDDACETDRRSRVSRSLLQAARSLKVRSTIDEEGDGGSSTPSPTPSPVNAATVTKSFGSTLNFSASQSVPSLSLIGVASKRLRALNQSIIFVILVALALFGVGFWLVDWDMDDADKSVRNRTSAQPHNATLSINTRDVTIPDKSVQTRAPNAYTSMSLHLPKAVPAAHTPLDERQRSSGFPHLVPCSAASTPMMSSKTVTAGIAALQAAATPMMSSKTVAAFAVPKIKLGTPAKSPTPPVARDPGAIHASSPRLSHLCPGLVVPRGSECILAMPLPEGIGMPPRDRISFDARDLQGKPVIRCEIARADWSVTGRQTIVILRAAASASAGPLADGQLGTLLARCEAVSEDGDRRSTHVYRQSGDLYAKITRDPYRTCYVLTTSGGSASNAGTSEPAPQMLFDGNFEEHAVTVTNEHREPLADTVPCDTTFDPNTPHIKLRVVSGVDVGIVLCGLLSIDQMESR